MWLIRCEKIKENYIYEVVRKSENFSLSPSLPLSLSRVKVVQGRSKEQKGPSKSENTGQHVQGLAERANFLFRVISVSPSDSLALHMSSPRSSLRSAACLETLRALVRGNSQLQRLSSFAFSERFFIAVACGEQECHFPPRRHAKTIALATCVAISGVVGEDPDAFGSLMARATLVSFQGSCSEYLSRVVAFARAQQKQQSVSASVSEPSSSPSSPSRYPVSSVKAVQDVVDKALVDTGNGKWRGDVQVGTPPKPRERKEGDDVDPPPLSVIVSVPGSSRTTTEKIVRFVEDELGEIAEVSAEQQYNPGPKRGFVPSEEQKKLGSVTGPRDAPRLDPSDPAIAKAASALLRGEAQKLRQSHSNIVATFIGPQAKDGYWTGKAALVVVVKKKGLIPLNETPLPRDFCGLPVDVEEGYVKSCVAPECFMFPGKNPGHMAQGGMSIGTSSHVPLAGTMGMLVQDLSSEHLFGLTCAHVLADGSRTVQAPAIVDLPVDNPPRVAVGAVLNYLGPEHDAPAKVQIDGANSDIYVSLDCAIFSIQNDLLPFAMKGVIQQPARVPGVPVNNVPMPSSTWSLQETIDNRGPVSVSKMGRTTGFTQGLFQYPAFGDVVVEDLRWNKKDEAAVGVAEHGSLTDIQYQQETTTRVLLNQIIIHPEASAFADGGDSGAIVVDDNGRVLGLLCAVLYVRLRSSGIVTPVEPVFDALQVRLWK